MSETAFNLADEPWIRVMLPDCTMKEVSMMEALIGAHHYKGLAGEMEAQNVALLRLLIAMVHTVFTRVNLEGNDDPVEDEKTALTRWTALMGNGSFPEQPVRDYLAKWHERFWLLHPEWPFYQVPGAKNGTVNTAAKLNGEVSESNNKARLFSFLTGNGRQTMSYAEGARWLLFLNGFDDCAAKQKDKSTGSRSMTIAWLGKLGLVTAVGHTLFETILLNMVMLADSTRELWENDDLPVWELDKPCAEERRTIPMPSDLAGLMTLQSRRIMLIPEGDEIQKYGILGGDAFSEQNALDEPMTLWRHIEDKKAGTVFFIPRRHDRAKQIWRDFGALVNDSEKERRPGVVSWCQLLQQKGFINAKRMITFRFTCVRYDSSQSSSITDSFTDAISFHADLLIEQDKTWLQEINGQVHLIEEAAGALGDLAINLAKACGQREGDLQAASQQAKEQYYLAVDLPFRDWLRSLNSDQGTEERRDLIIEWQRTAKRTALNIGMQLVEEKGDIAFVGRMVTDAKKIRHYSSPEAYQWFKYNIGAIYPFIQEGDAQHGQIKSR